MSHFVPHYCELGLELCIVLYKLLLHQQPDHPTEMKHHIPFTMLTGRLFMSQCQQLNTVNDNSTSAAWLFLVTLPFCPVIWLAFTMSYDNPVMSGGHVWSANTLATMHWCWRECKYHKCLSAFVPFVKVLCNRAGQLWYCVGKYGIICHCFIITIATITSIRELVISAGNGSGCQLMGSGFGFSLWAANMGFKTAVSESTLTLCVGFQVTASTWKSPQSKFWSLKVLRGPSRYWQESPIYDKVGHQNIYWK